ncbi:GNAT family N-acetyltransferase [Crocinitomix algicola]|uniref:GNAT family N-acetyltransferase n=1 Tax=Crocinitomix algicola TaxID=1740263 RepID=UPI000833E361|nr:GNAT family N-acetyltransferase [Crocinitomix algicola]
MNIEVKHYSELTKEEFHDLVALRIEVFVVEQHCPYQDLDGKDKDAYHLLAKMNNEIIGTARILKKGVSYPEMAIGRVVTSPKYRNLKLGHKLMETAINYIENICNEKEISLSAQSHLTGFYEKHGFQSTNKTYLEDNIPHTEMLYNNKG